jgi:hypothetical protein
MNYKGFNIKNYNNPTFWIFIIGLAILILILEKTK